MTCVQRGMLVSEQNVWFPEEPVRLLGSTWNWHSSLDRQITDKQYLVRSRAVRS